MNIKNIYFVPCSQDDANLKPTSMIAEFKKIPETIEAALKGIQLQPIIAWFIFKNFVDLTRILSNFKTLLTIFENYAKISI